VTNRVPLDLANSPRDNLYAFGKTWGTFSEDPVVSVFHGAMFGSVGSDRLVPLFGYAGTGVTKVRFVDDDTLQMRGKETGFFYDLKTEEIIDSWDNPYTGETVEVYHFLNDRIGGQLTTEMPKLYVGDDPEHGVHMNENIETDATGGMPFILPWAAYGDELLLEWDYAHEYPNPVDPVRYPKSSTGPVINPSEHFVMYVSKAELEDRDKNSAHFRGGFSRISPWWPWMRMGGSAAQDGKMIGRLHSRKTINGLDDIPPKLLARTMKQVPDYLEAPKDWDMGPILSSWEAYARDTAPEA
jgi:hypothetical protein